MPTGYTADIGDGTVTDFRTFALRCARNFGATIMQRDNPMNEPPKHRVPSNYSAKALTVARNRLAELDSFTLDDAERAAQAEFSAALKSHDQYAVNRAETKGRYKAMIAEVEQWTPPTADHIGMKTFMLSQLTESIEFDCTDYGSRRPERVGAADWLDAAKAKARKDVARHAEEDAAERERCASSNRWIDSLYASLPTKPEPRRSAKRRT